MSQPTPKIAVDGLAKRFGDNPVLDDVSFSLAEGESLVLFGTSGSGKSLVLKCILGLIAPDGGSVRIDGEETTGASAREHTALMDRIGMLFQYSGLFDSLPIWENVAFQLTNYRGMGRKQAREIAVAKLAAVGLKPETADLFPSEISGGMQKRVGIARAIAIDPKILFLDEPTAGLDPIMSNRINELILQAMEELGATVISITSDMRSARQISNRMAMLHDGGIIWSGPTSQLDESGSEHVHQFVNQLAEGPIKMRVRAA